jgi:hypothetical protein
MFGEGVSGSVPAVDDIWVGVEGIVTAMIRPEVSFMVVSGEHGLDDIVCRHS